MSRSRPPLDRVQPTGGRTLRDAAQNRRGRPPPHELTLCHQSEEAVEAVCSPRSRRAAPMRSSSSTCACLRARDGVWAARSIRALDPETLIVIVTGHSDVDPTDIARLVPPPDRLLYVQKPFQHVRDSAVRADPGSRWLAEQALRDAVRRAGLSLGNYSGYGRFDHFERRAARSRHRSGRGVRSGSSDV